MSDNALVTLGLVAIAGLALIPVVMVGRVAVAIILESRKNRAAEARRVTCSVAGLGEFSTTDDEVWSGEVDGLLVTLKTRGQPPNENDSARIRAILDELPRHADSARAFLLSTDAREDLAGNAAHLRGYGIDWIDASSFVLELVNPADDESVYCVEFRDGAPVGWGMDH